MPRPAVRDVRHASLANKGGRSKTFSVSPSLARAYLDGKPSRMLPDYTCPKEGLPEDTLPARSTHEPLIYKHKKTINQALKILSVLFRRLPTFALRLSSALRRLTSLFGMGRGVTTASNHQNKKLKKQQTGKKLRAVSVRCLHLPTEIGRISIPRLSTSPCVHLGPINVVIFDGPHNDF